MNLKITGASKSFGKKKIFQGLSLEIQTGEIIGLFGRNGSGKSTLLKMVFGVMSADSLDLQVDDRIIAPNEIIPKKLIAYLPQDRFLPALMSVRKIIPLYFTDEKTLDKIFYDPAVASFEARKYEELSEGQKKYLEILLISHLNHPFLLLDEPFAMIDPLYKDLIKKRLTNIKRNKGIIVTDHYYQDVLQISDRNYLIKDGQISSVQGESELREYGYLSDRLRKEH